MNRLTSGLAILAAGTLLATLAAETAMRRFRFAPMQLGLPALGGVAGCADRSDGIFRFRYNEDGDRTAPASAALAGSFDVVVLGDSHAWGSCVDDENRFTDLVTTRSRAAADAARVTVWNAAQPGSSFLEYADALPRVVERYRPRLVLVAFYSGNDLLELGARPARSPVPPDRAAVPLLRGVHVYHFLRGLFGVWPDHAAFCNSGPYTQALAQAAWSRRDPEAARQALVAAGALMARMREDCERRRLRLEFLALPSRLAVDAQDGVAGTASTPAAALGIPAAEAIEQNDASHRALVAAAGSVAPVLDARPALVSASRQGARVFWETDWHLDDAGHRIVADLVFERLRQEALGAER